MMQLIMIDLPTDEETVIAISNDKQALVNRWNEYVKECNLIPVELSNHTEAWKLEDEWDNTWVTYHICDIEEVKPMNAVYLIYKLYDVDGGYGDAINKELLVGYVNDRDAAIQYCKENENPRITEKPYDYLMDGVYRVDEIIVSDTVEKSQKQVIYCTEYDYHELIDKFRKENNIEDDDEEDYVEEDIQVIRRGGEWEVIDDYNLHIKYPTLEEAIDFAKQRMEALLQTYICREGYTYTLVVDDKKQNSNVVWVTGTCVKED